MSLPKEKVLSRELDGYMEAHRMRRSRVRNSDCFVFLRLCDFRERRRGVCHNQGFDTPSGFDTMKRRRKREKTECGVNLEYSFLYIFLRVKYRDIYSGLRRRGDDVDELLWGETVTTVSLYRT